MSVNHKKLVSLAATYSLSCDGYVPVKVADWNFFIDLVNGLTEENARLREALGHMVRNFDYHWDRLDSAQCNSLDEAKQLLKGEEDE